MERYIGVVTHRRRVVLTSEVLTVFNNKTRGECQQPQPKLYHRVYNLKVRSVHILVRYCKKCSKLNSKRFANNLALRDAVKQHTRCKTCQRQCCKIDAVDKSHRLRTTHCSHFENLLDCKKLDLEVKVESRRYTVRSV